MAEANQEQILIRLRGVMSRGQQATGATEMNGTMTQDEIDRLNVEIKIPQKDGRPDFSESRREEWYSQFITREDGRRISLADSTFADWEYVMESQKRAAERAMAEMAAIRKAAELTLDEEDFLKIFGRPQ